jgi:hypothetical protein
MKIKADKSQLEDKNNRADDYIKRTGRCPYANPTLVEFQRQVYVCASRHYKIKMSMN